MAYPDLDDEYDEVERPLWTPAMSENAIKTPVRLGEERRTQCEFCEIPYGRHNSSVCVRDERRGHAWVTKSYKAWVDANGQILTDEHIADCINNHARLTDENARLQAALHGSVTATANALDELARLNSMIEAAKRIQGEYWHVERREGENIPEWYAENPQILRGPFNNPLDAFESLTKQEEGE